MFCHVQRTPTTPTTTTTTTQTNGKIEYKINKQGELIATDKEHNNTTTPESPMVTPLVSPPGMPMNTLYISRVLKHHQRYILKVQDHQTLHSKITQSPVKCKQSTAIKHDHTWTYISQLCMLRQLPVLHSPFCLPLHSVSLSANFEFSSHGKWRITLTGCNTFLAIGRFVFGSDIWPSRSTAR